MKSTLFAVTSLLAATFAPSGPAVLHAQQAATAIQSKPSPTPTAQRVDEVRKSRSAGTALAALGLHGFSIVLVVGDMQAPSSAADNVPGAAKKALNDMRDFLPYKNYRLLDAGWVLCCGSSFSSVSGRLRGSDESEYSYDLSTTQVADSKITLRFSLREVSAASESTPTPPPVASETARAFNSQQLYEVMKERDEAERQAAQLKGRYEVGTAPKGEYEAALQRYQRALARSEDLRRQLGEERAVPVRRPTSRPVMDSTFAISVGETVVIGTSRLKGDKALIALLTAANKPSPAR